MQLESETRGVELRGSGGEGGDSHSLTPRC